MNFWHQFNFGITWPSFYSIYLMEVLWLLFVSVTLQCEVYLIEVLWLLFVSVALQCEVYLMEVLWLLFVSVTLSLQCVVYLMEVLWLLFVSVTLQCEVWHNEGICNITSLIICFFVYNSLSEGLSDRRTWPVKISMVR